MTDQLILRVVSNTIFLIPNHRLNSTYKYRYTATVFKNRIKCLYHKRSFCDLADKIGSLLNLLVVKKKNLFHKMLAIKQKQR